MIKVRSNNSLRYHVYHIVTLFYPAGKIEYLDEADLSEADIVVTVEEEVLTVRFFATLTVHDYPDRNLNIMRRVLFKLLEIKTEKHLPWGILIGIRPSKIVRELIEKNQTKEEITAFLQKEYLADREKIELAYEVALKESDLLKKVDTEHSVDIYIGMPFCPSRCLYCSFASNVYRGNQYKDEYLKLLKMEMMQIRDYIDDKELKINNVYFGGGTPTAVSEDEFEEMMQCIDDCFVRGRNLLEFTVEAGRVDSITKEKLLSMKRHHTTRISINPQTMNDDTLRLIGRNHDHQKVVEIFHLARSLGFDNINMDMILGLPEESLQDVERTIEAVRDLSPESITVHGLALKRASRLYEDFLMEKKYALPRQDEMNLMYQKTDEMARSLGQKPYYMYRQKNMVGNLENVGYAKEGMENLYNMVMIEEVKTIIAVGADGVTKKVKDGVIERFANFKGLNDYTERFQEMMEKKMKFLME
ncbi:coproporphyrinogen dehydrogenase HemZ [Proteiniclasticum sp. C24MP]|uniref:coproporphyrinogen dehydrogenase HemZ n=1 Tax=Proteiniclasticum sp. C24MP TaxID=3374101 RepID=UPI0037550CB9